MSQPRREADPTVATVGETALIERIRSRAGEPPAWVVLGIGDDAAVLEPERGALDVVTTDSLVEGVHFRRDWTPARAIGRKALAVNLSDLAAMGATPRASLLSLSLPASLPLAEFDALVDGFVTLATAVKSPLVGGNLTRSPGPLVVDVTAIGSVRRRRVLTRRGGRPGDELFVTGLIGAAAAGLGLLSRPAGRTGLTAIDEECIRKYEEPDARLRCGRVVAGRRAASACADLSDGLADAARQIALASRTGVVIDAEHVPVHPGAAAWASAIGKDPVELALTGGEDYELLFAVPPRKRRSFFAAAQGCEGLAMTAVGRLTAEPGSWLSRSGRLEPLGAGFVHF